MTTIRVFLRAALASAALVSPALAQRSALAGADSLLVGRILLAEDRRDSANTVFAEASAHGDARIQQLARRAAARIRDTLFATRDSFPAAAAPPAYPDPAWRIRFRGLTANARNCAALRTALTDSAWSVRLRAVDLVDTSCATDAALLGTLREWAQVPNARAARTRGGVSWHTAAHALVALARIAPSDARSALPRAVTSPIPWLRVYAARAADRLADTATLRQLARDPNDNVKEVAITALSRHAGHAADAEYIAALSARGYQAIRAGARALAGSPRGADVLRASLETAQRLRRDSSETSRDARLMVIQRIGEFAQQADDEAVAALATDFHCETARAAAAIATRLGAANPGPRCTPMPITLPPDAVALAMGRDVRLRVTLADSSGGGSFTVRLRGDVAPIMAARVLALARAGYYNGTTWHRVEPDFVIQGGSPSANEIVGHPRFFRDELGTLSHARGTVGMSTRGHDTGDAQWFVNLRDNARLTRLYTVFGEVVEGIEIVDGVLEGDVIAKIEVIPVR